MKIFATDVHRGSLERAAARRLRRAGRARTSRPSGWNATSCASARRYQVVPELRQAIVFAAHNVIKDAPFTRVDLVSCRNMLIYFQPPVQQKVMSQFHFALNRGGVMMLGPSESPGALLTGLRKSGRPAVAHVPQAQRCADTGRSTSSPATVGRRTGQAHEFARFVDSPFARYSMSNLLAHVRRPPRGLHAAELARQRPQRARPCIWGREPLPSLPLRPSGPRRARRRRQ